VSSFGGIALICNAGIKSDNKNKELCSPNYYVDDDHPAEGLRRITCMDEHGKTNEIFIKE
jgi:hypothetical protein